MKAAIRGGALGSMLLVVVACGPSSVQRVSGPSGALPRPDRILVYDFAVTPDEVRLDSGLSTQLGQLFGGGQDPAGRTGVQASVQVYEITPEGMRNVESLQADAKSSYKPGMALMMGAGGLAGNLLTSAVVSGITSAASEATWDTVNSDGSRLAKNVTKNLGQFFVIQGWISPEALQ